LKRLKRLGMRWLLGEVRGSMGWEWSVYEYVKKYRGKRKREDKGGVGGKE